MSGNPTTALATIDLSSYLALREEAEELRELVDEYLEDGLSENDLHLIKIPAGGGMAWELPGDTTASTFDGVILAVQNTRAYFPQAFTGGANPPACSSRDGKTGVGLPGGSCLTCEKAIWGSGKEHFGTACGERKIVYILMPGETLPVRLSLPVTSFKILRKYQVSLLNKRYPSHGVVTQFGLEKAKSQSGITYSVLKLSQVTPISGDMADRAKAYATMLKSALFHQPDLQAPPSSPVSDDAIPWGAELDEDSVI